MVTRSTHGFSFSDFFLFRTDSRGIFIAAEKGMSFGSPFIGNDLIEVPGEEQVNKSIDDETGESSADGVLIDTGSKTWSNLVRFSEEHGSESQHECSVGNDADGSIYAGCGVIRIGGDEGDDVLDEEEEESDDDSYFSAGEEDLNEEILDDEDDIE